MKLRPVANEPQRRRRLDVAHEHFTAEVELALLTLVLSVEMCGFVLLVEHPNEPQTRRRATIRRCLAWCLTTDHALPALLHVLR